MSNQYIRYPASGSGSGTVTSVGLTMPNIFSVANSPVTGAGTIGVTFTTETANTIFAGPTTGAAATPTFRALVAADIPSLPYSPSALTSAHIFVGNASNVATDVAMSGDVAIDNAGATTIQAGAITNTKVSASAAIAFSKLAALSSANILVGNVSNVATSVAMSGDITIDNAGVTAIGALKVTNGMLAGSIAFSKLAALSSGNILVGNVSNVAASVTMSGDITIDNAGVTAIGALKVTNAMLAGSIAYSKLSLSNSIVNADISSSAAIVYSKLSLTTSIVNGDISTSAAIARSKLAAGTVNHVVINDGSTGAFSSEANLAISRGGTGAGTKAAGFDALSPMTTAGDLIYGGASGTGTRLAVGAAATVLRSDGTNPSWVSPSLLSAKSADYTVTTSDNIATILMTTSSTNRTVTLPAAANCNNRIITIKKVDTGTGKCTVDANASETIDGALTYDLLYQYEAITIQCDGSNWYIVDYQPSKWLAFTPTYLNTNGNLGTTSARLRKEGKKIDFEIVGSWTGAGAAASFQITPPVAAGASVGNVACGYGTFERGGAVAERPYISRFSSGSMFFFEAGSSTPIQGNAFANTDVVHMYATYEVD